MLDLKEQFQKTEEILGKEPWASIVNFVDQINAKHPKALSLKLDSIDFREGVAAISIQRHETGTLLAFKSYTAPSHEAINRQTPSNNTLFLPHTEMSLRGVLCKQKGGKIVTSILGGLSTPLRQIQEQLVPDIDLGFKPKEPSLEWQKLELSR